jgi:hypothetical protein
MISIATGGCSMNGEDDREAFAKEIESLQKRLDRHQILLELLSLSIVLLLVHIFVGIVIIEIAILPILIFGFLYQVERKGI